MASSGWQSEKLWFTWSSNIHLNGNIYISSITHSGTNLRIQGKIAGCPRGSSGYYFSYADYTSYAQPEGGSKIALGAKGRTWKVGGGDVNVNFDVTLTNVAAGTTSRSFYVNFYGPDTTSVKATLRWTLSFNPSGDPPSGYSSSEIVPEWDKITFRSIVSSPNGNITAYCPCISKVPLVAGTPKYENGYSSSSVSPDLVSTITNNSTKVSNPNWTIQGCGYYYTGAYVQTINGTLYGQGDGTYTPPSPSELTAVDPGGTSTKTYSVAFYGIAGDNNSDYEQAELKRTVRYKINSGNWTYVVQDSVAAIDAETAFSVTVPAGSIATVEGWQTYHGIQSEVTTRTLNNTNIPCHTYGSVNGQSKEVRKLYASVGGQSKRIRRLYASVNGQSKLIFIDAS